MDYFAEVEKRKEHNGYFCSVKETLALVILGSFCGLRNVKLIHQWAINPRVKEYLSSNYGIKHIPCYYWILCLMKLIVPASFNRCFIEWVKSLIPKNPEGYTVSFDGKTICSTCKMEKYKSPLHIVSAHIAEMGITFGQQAVYDKSNEIPAVRDLIAMLNLEGCMVVADALNCQKETAKAIIKAKADYLLDVKDNHADIKADLEDYVQDPELQQTMDKATTLEKNGGRIERRSAFTTDDIAWLYGKDEWVKLTTIGAIHTQVQTPKGISDEWHYYISSRKLTADELLRHARLEWSVESMHWLLDVHFDEDSCRVEDKDVQQNLNIVRKTVLNCIRQYKDKTGIKHPFSKIMFDCLLEPQYISSILSCLQN